MSQDYRPFTARAAALRDARAHRFAMLASQVSTFARGDATISSQSSTRRTTSVRRVVEAKESRIGKQPVQVPQGVTYTLKDNHLAVKVRAKTTV